MPEVERYDAVVLGSGEAGKYMAWHLGASGKRWRPSNANTLEVPAQTSPASRAKT